MLKPGDKAPSFALNDQNNHTVDSKDLLGEGRIVLFFYPKAMTSGCTKESCHFRDLDSEFRAVGARPVGISADSVDRQLKFDSKHSLGFTLLSDPDRRVAGAFGVKRPGPLFNRRATFVIDTDGTVVEAFSSEINMDEHADRALGALQALQERN